MTDDDADGFRNRFRIDFKFEVVVDPGTGDKRIVMVLEPTRYEIRQEKDETVVVDRLDHLVFSLRDIQDMVREALSRAPTGRGQQLGDGRAYIATRREQIERDWDGPSSEDAKFVDRSEEYLEQLSDGVHAFAVLSADLVGSTLLSRSLDSSSYARIISLVLRELAIVCPYFNAHLLKFTGDGVIAYFPMPSFLTANDNAIDCALTMRSLIRYAVNPNLTERGYPTLEVRIGIESGGAVAATVGHSTSKLHRDLIGKTINTACKIQASTKPGEIRLGDIAYRNMHTMWKRGCELAPPADVEALSLADGSYPIHIFSAAGAVLD